MTSCRPLLDLAEYLFGSPEDMTSGEFREEGGVLVDPKVPKVVSVIG